MTLFAIALPEEARYVPSGARVCITGPGKVRSAVTLARALTDVPTHRVVNIGTAGALRNGLPAPAHRIGRVMEHNFDASAIERLTARRYHNDLVLGEGLALATGDTFLADSRQRVALAAHADLVDMEGFATPTPLERSEWRARCSRSSPTRQTTGPSRGRRPSKSPPPRSGDW